MTLIYLKYSSTDVKWEELLMATFEINGNEYELKLNYEAIKLLNNAYKGGSMELIGQVLSSNIEVFPVIIHAGLLHTGENISKQQIEEELSNKINNQKLSLEDLRQLGGELVTENFFFKPTLDKMLASDPKMKKAYEQLMSI